MKKIAQYILKWFAKAVIKKFHPIVVGITGSVGKTTSKEAIAFMLKDHLDVRSTAKNYNNEIGVPLTILGIQKEPGRSLMAWSGIVARALFLLCFSRRYPQVLVLEMGVDRPGDMTYLLTIVRPHIAVETGVSSSHIEFFGSLEAIAEEKGKLAEAVKKEGHVILNADNSYTWAMRRRVEGKVISYGYGKRSDLRAFGDSVALEGSFQGLRLKIEHNRNIIPFYLKNVIARHHVEATLTALAVGSALGLNVIDCMKSLREFTPPPGRFRVLEGERGSILIDDTYNASPTSTKAAILALKDLHKEQTVVILGDMLELGGEEVTAHRGLAQEIVKTKIKSVIVVGDRMKALFERLCEYGYGADCLWWVRTPMEVHEIAKRIIGNNTVVLVKGSQGMRMELVVESLLAHPEHTSLLCRQTSQWKAKTFVQP